MRKFSPLLSLLLVLSLLLSFAPAASAQAQNITENCTVTATGFSSTGFLTDKKQTNYQTSSGSTSITLENTAGIGSLYLLFDTECGSYTVTDNTSNKSFTAGQHGILHEFVDLTAQLGAAPTSVTLDFGTAKVRLGEIYAFATSDTPDFVQKWTAPLDGGADIVLFSTHGDDDQLYFAGLLPLYAGSKGARVQVVYMTDHRTGPYATNTRKHEMLNGLWTNGVTAYPVFGTFEDFRIDSLQGTYDEYRDNYNTTEEELLSWVVEQIRRFKPLVAVGHDINGEYGHGMHMVYTDLLIKSLPVTGDAAQFPESAQKYGAWALPKLYLHLYEENTIVLDIDTPLDEFDGLSAFNVAQKLGFPCHESQQGHGFYRWLNGSNNEITKASQITKYNPAHFGLYHTAVGADTGKNDFLENVTTYAEQERIEAERLEAERLEQERLEQERQEAERLEQERLEQERLEQVRLEQERLEAQRLQASQKREKENTVMIIILIVLVFCEIIAVSILIARKRKKKSR